MERIFMSEQIVKRPIAEVFEFFAQAENLQRITPPLLDFKIISPLPVEMKEGTLIDYRLKIRGLPMKWKTLISTWEPPYRFIDQQLKGPYKTWHHTHEFTSLGPNETLMKDIVRYEVPFGFLGMIAEIIMVKKDIQKIFEFRRQEIDRLFS